MCGIVGVIALNNKGRQSLPLIDAAVKTLHKRGPDYSGSMQFDDAALGHARLAVIDTSEGGAQPFTSEDGRYNLVFNGEIYNYKLLKQQNPKFNTFDFRVLQYKRYF